MLTRAFRTFACLFAAVAFMLACCPVAHAATQDRWEKLLAKYEANDTVNQLIFVKYKGNSKANVVLFVKKDGVWVKKLSCSGLVGQCGIGKQREGDKKTPTGTYNITGAFGIKSDPGAKLGYTKVTNSMYWCGDKKWYNQMVDVLKKKYRHSCAGEHLIRYKGYYDYCLAMDYNASCTFKKGSAIFMHCNGGESSTSGCIAVDKKHMVKILRNVEDGAKICIYKK